MMVTAKLLDYFFFCYRLISYGTIKWDLRLDNPSPCHSRDETMLLQSKYITEYSK